MEKDYPPGKRPRLDPDQISGFTHFLILICLQ